MLNDVVTTEIELYGDHPFKGFERLPDYSTPKEYFDFETQQVKEIYLYDLAVVGMDGGCGVEESDSAMSSLASLTTVEISEISHFLGKKETWLTRRARLPVSFTKVLTASEFHLGNYIEQQFWPNGPNGQPPSTAAQAKDMNFVLMAAMWNRKICDAWRARANTITVDRPGGNGEVKISVRELSPKVGCAHFFTSLPTRQTAFRYFITSAASVLLGPVYPSGLGNSPRAQTPSHHAPPTTGVRRWHGGVARREQEPRK